MGDEDKVLVVFIAEKMGGGTGQYVPAAGFPLSEWKLRRQRYEPRYGRLQLADPRRTRHQQRIGTPELSGLSVRAPNVLQLQESFEHSIWGPFGLKFTADPGFGLQSPETQLRHRANAPSRSVSDGVTSVCLGKRRGQAYHRKHEYFVAGWYRAALPLL